MNNLKIFENNNWSKKHYNHLEIKGGIRYFTNHQPDFKQKKKELNYQGIQFDASEHDGIFCIEW